MNGGLHGPGRTLGVTLEQMIGESLWNALVAKGRPREHRSGDVLLWQGDRGTHVLVLCGGVVKVSRVERDGRVRVLAFRGGGDVVGEAAVIEEDETRLASVEAISHCRVSVVSKREFLDFRDLHELTETLHRHTAMRWREATRVGDGDSRTRLAVALLALASAACPEGPPTAVEVAVTRLDLAQYLGVSRNTVSTTLQSLGERTVTAERKSIVIRDIAALRSIADAG
ncbi:Crp/Fnr family transcriptional regulator [Streptomyces sp. NPDC021096]|uniref:Crp/Fnr family transcriptional regulator n=1 Tax=Streptomyces sp. NPDC021096 TaxID=3154792 RepID=UPI0033F90BAD